MYSVVIVEDDPMVSMINRQYTNSHPDFNVIQIFRDGSTAYEYLIEKKTDLIILDVYMSRTDGLTLLRKIREAQLSVSVIMVTAANDSATIEEALRLGITDYLIKPFSAARFQQALETFRKRQETLHDLPSLNQRHIDALMGNTQKSSSQLPKGIQAKTFETLCAFLEQNCGRELTGDEIADKVELSRVTVKRYMNYMLEKNLISGRMDYETGGRPSMRYRWGNNL